MNNTEITLDEIIEHSLKKYKISKIPFTFTFNECTIEVNENSTYSNLSHYYYNNVDLTQFQGWGNNV